MIYIDVKRAHESFKNIRYKQNDSIQVVNYQTVPAAIVKKAFSVLKQTRIEIVLVDAYDGHLKISWPNGYMRIRKYDGAFAPTTNWNPDQFVIQQPKRSLPNV